MTLLKLLLSGFMGLFLLNACTKVHTQTEFHGIGNLKAKDGIVLLSKLDSIQDFDDKDVDKCIRPSMIKANPELRFISADLFRKNMYPYFSAGTTPRDLEDFKRILGKTEVMQRIESLGVRYVIVMTKSRTSNNWHDGIICGAGYGGGGCFGLSWWNRESELGLAVWDLQEKSLAGNMRAKATGTGVMPALLLPVPLYAPATKSAVCKEIGFRLGKLLSGQE